MQSMHSMHSSLHACTHSSTHLRLRHDLCQAQHDAAAAGGAEKVEGQRLQLLFFDDRL